MSKLKAEVLFESLISIADPQRDHRKFHSLFDILVISICAVIPIPNKIDVLISVINFAYQRKIGC